MNYGDYKILLCLLLLSNALATLATEVEGENHQQWLPEQQPLQQQPAKQHIVLENGKLHLSLALKLKMQKQEQMKRNRKQQLSMGTAGAITTKTTTKISLVKMRNVNSKQLQKWHRCVQMLQHSVNNEKNKAKKTAAKTEVEINPTNSTTPNIVGEPPELATVDHVAFASQINVMRPRNKKTRFSNNIKNKSNNKSDSHGFPTKCTLNSGNVTASQSDMFVVHNKSDAVDRRNQFEEVFLQIPKSTKRNNKEGRTKLDSIEVTGINISRTGSILLSTTYTERAGILIKKLPEATSKEIKIKSPTNISIKINDLQVTSTNLQRAIASPQSKRLLQMGKKFHQRELQKSSVQGSTGGEENHSEQRTSKEKDTFVNYTKVGKRNILRNRRALGGVRYIKNSFHELTRELSDGRSEKNGTERSYEDDTKGNLEDVTKKATEEVTKVATDGQLENKLICNEISAERVIKKQNISKKAVDIARGSFNNIKNQTRSDTRRFVPSTAPEWAVIGTNSTDIEHECGRDSKAAYVSIEGNAAVHTLILQNDTNNSNMPTMTAANMHIDGNSYSNNNYRNDNKSSSERADKLLRKRKEIGNNTTNTKDTSIFGTTERSITPSQAVKVVDSDIENKLITTESNDEDYNASDISTNTRRATTSTINTTPTMTKQKNVGTTSAQKAPSFKATTPTMISSLNGRNTYHIKTPRTPSIYFPTTEASVATRIYKSLEDQANNNNGYNSNGQRNSTGVEPSLTSFFRTNTDLKAVSSSLISLNSPSNTNTMSTINNNTVKFSYMNSTTSTLTTSRPSTTSSNNDGSDNGATTSTITPATWPVKHASVMEGDVILGGLMMVHSREDTITCGPIMPQGGIQALEAMLYTLDRVNQQQLLPNITLGAHILDDCDKDTYGLEMAVDFIKGECKINNK